MIDPVEQEGLRQLHEYYRDHPGYYRRSYPRNNHVQKYTEAQKRRQRSKNKWFIICLEHNPTHIKLYANYNLYGKWWTQDFNEGFGFYTREYANKIQQKLIYSDTFVASIPRLKRMASKWIRNIPVVKEDKKIQKETVVKEKHYEQKGFGGYPVIRRIKKYHARTHHKRY